MRRKSKKGELPLALHAKFLKYAGTMGGGEKLPEPPQEKGELKLLQCCENTRGGQRAQGKSIERERKRDVPHQLRHALAEKCLITSPFKFLAQHRRHRGKLCIELLQGPELLEKFGSTLRPYAMHAREIIRRVARQPLPCGDLIGAHAVFLVNILWPQRLRLLIPLVGDDDAHSVARKLQGIPVTSNDGNTHTRPLPGRRIRTQKIISLVAGIGNMGEAERIDDLQNEGNLTQEIFRRFLAPLLVRRVLLMTKRLPARIEAEKQGIGSFLLQNGQEHRRHPEHRIHLEARTRAERPRDRPVRPVHQMVPINKYKMAHSHA